MYGETQNINIYKIFGFSLNSIMQFYKKISIFIHPYLSTFTKVSEQIMRHFYLDILKIQIEFVLIFQC